MATDDRRPPLLVSDVLDELSTWAATQRVTLTLFERSPTCWEIDHLERDPETPAGLGRVVIERVQREAQAHGCAVVLAVTGCNNVLMDYYAHLGFHPDGAPDDETGDQSFRWEPQQDAPAPAVRAANNPVAPSNAKAPGPRRPRT